MARHIVIHNALAMTVTQARAGGGVVILAVCLGCYSARSRIDDERCAAMHRPKASCRLHQRRASIAVIHTIACVIAIAAIIY